MIQRLDIKNIALIESLTMEFASGLTILTGETGSGKSVILSALSAVLGERVSREMLRQGADKGVICVTFTDISEKAKADLEAKGIEMEGEDKIIAVREISAAGKNNCFINGMPVTIGMLKNLLQPLVDIHGQYDNQSLLKTENCLQLLDLFGGNKIKTLSAQYREVFFILKERYAQYRSIHTDRMEREQKLDLYRYQIKEIDDAQLNTEEEAQLERQRTVMRNAAKIMDALSGTCAALFDDGDSVVQAGMGGGCAYDALSEALGVLSAIVPLDERYQGYGDKLNEMLFVLDDLKHEIRAEKESMDMDPANLEEVEARWELIKKLKRKYGETVQDILSYRAKIGEMSELLEKGEQTSQELEQTIMRTTEELSAIGELLHQERVKAAAVLESSIATVLTDLEMKHTRLKVRISMDAAALDASELSQTGTMKLQANETGLDKVEFLISTNKGEALKPLSKIASGGEMARIMLAIKTILADVDEVPTLVFDEVDTGISGAAAKKTAQKLMQIAAVRQVVCVTHLPQIAAAAERHVVIEKQVKSDRTLITARQIAGEEVVEEVAGIAGAREGAGKEYARELLQEAAMLRDEMWKK